MSDLTKNLAKKLKVLRKEKGFSIEEAAFQAGIATSYISDLERGAKKISTLHTLEKIATVYKLELVDLLTFDENRDTENSIRQTVSKLTPAERKSVVRVLKTSLELAEKK